MLVAQKSGILHIEFLYVVASHLSQAVVLRANPQLAIMQHHVGDRITRHASVGTFEHRLLATLLVYLHNATLCAHIKEVLVVDDFHHEVLARNVPPVRQLGMRR